MCECVCSRVREREGEGGRGIAPLRFSKYHSPAVLVPFDSHNLSRTGEQRRVCTRQGACGTKRRRIATMRLLEVRASVKVKVHSSAKRLVARRAAPGYLFVAYGPSSLSFSFFYR